MTLEKNDFTKSHLAPPNLAQIIIWNLENLEFPSFSWFLGHTRLDFRDSESILQVVQKRSGYFQPMATRLEF